MTSNLGIRSIGNRLRVSALAQRSLLRPQSRGGTVASRSLVTKGHLLQQLQQLQQQDHKRQQPRQRQFAIDTPRYGIRNFHRSCTRLDEEKELSPKEKKKLLKAKAKAAVAEQQEDAAAEKKKELQEKLAAKKAAAAGEEPPSAATEEEPAPAPLEEAPKEETAPETEDEAHTSAKETAPEKEKEASKETKSTSPPSSEPVEYSTPELTADAAKHKAGLDDPDLPYYQNPLHHNNPEMQKMFREDFESDEAFEAAKVPLPPMDLGDGKVPAPEYIYAIADEIVHLNMLEMNELVNKMAEHYGFHEGILSPDDDGGDGDEDDEDGGGEAAPKEEAKTSFDIKLVEFDAKAKIKVIKEVRALAGLGLKEAKEMVEGAPKVIHKGVKKEEADEIKAKLEEIGATIEIV